MSNQYKYYNQKQANYVPSGPQQHSRAATYAKSKGQQYVAKPRSHLTSNSMQQSSNATQNDIETTRSDMRDILWQNAELLQSDPNYRKKVWRYMSKVFYGNTNGAKYKFENYAKYELPTSVRSAAPRRLTKTTTTSNRLNVIGKEQEEEQAPTPETKEEDILTQSKLKLLLDREETYTDFLINSNPNQLISMNRVRPVMERILTAYACANCSKLPLSGAVQLCAVILTTFSGDSHSISDTWCSDTFFILQILSDIMHPYYLFDSKLMKDETLLLIDVLCVNEDKLVRKLNSLSIDVIDLSVFVSSWIRCLFVHHFEIEFVQRVIDLVLLEGPSVLIAIVYGILQFIKNDILQCNTHYDVFSKLAGSKLKNYLKKHEFIARVIQKAQLLFTEENYKYVIRGREKKSWPDLLGLPGQRHFRITKGVGDKTKVKKAYQHWRRESRKNITSAYLGAEESSDDSEDDDDDGRNAHHHSHSSFGFVSNSNSTDILERKLADATAQIVKLQRQIIMEDVEEEEEPDGDEVMPRSGPTMIENHNNSLIIHDDGIKDEKEEKCSLSDVLFTSLDGDMIYQEPMTDNLAPREIQCRTENWTDSWKNALNSLTDASISMQGYLCKMTASKWNSRGTLDKIQRRWFVLRGNYMTYYKTNLHTQPKSDKCVNLLRYKVNPVIHQKSKYAFELISAPKENLHKKTKSMKFTSNDKNNGKNDYIERTKFILIPDLDVNDGKQREIRDKWVKSLRLATKGPFLWDVLLNLKIDKKEYLISNEKEVVSDNGHSNAHAHAQSMYYHSKPSYNHNPNHNHNYHYSSYNRMNNQSSSDSLQTYTRRQYKQDKQNKQVADNRTIGGNTQDYPDYPI